jgi:hypothetical protein
VADHAHVGARVSDQDDQISEIDGRVCHAESCQTSGWTGLPDPTHLPTLQSIATPVRADEGRRVHSDADAEYSAAAAEP